MRIWVRGINHHQLSHDRSPLLRVQACSEEHMKDRGDVRQFQRANPTDIKLLANG